MSFRDWPRAPATGARLLPEAELGACRTLDIGGFPVLLARTAAGLRGYVNACPHQFLPLDHRGGCPLTPDGQRLLCDNHGAVFDAGSGAVLAGPCEEGLEPLPLALADGWIVIAEG